MKDVTYKELSNDLGKSEATLKNWKQKFPVLLEYVKLGAFCKKNSITMEMLKNCIEITKVVKKEIETKEGDE